MMIVSEISRQYRSETILTYLEHLFLTYENKF